MPAFSCRPGPQTESCRLRRRFSNPLKIQCSGLVTKMASRYSTSPRLAQTRRVTNTRIEKRAPAHFQENYPWYTQQVIPMSGVSQIPTRDMESSSEVYRPTLVTINPGQE